MATDFSTSQSTILRVLKEDLKKKCYRKISTQKLQDHQKSQRKRCCTWIRKCFKREDLQKMMFTDEKVFNECGPFNPHNDVVWASSRSDVVQNDGVHMVKKYPISVMVAMGVTWNGLTMPFFFEKDQRLNGSMYCDQLLPFYKAEGDRLFGHQNWCLQQDGASSHSDKRAQNWCREHLDSFIPKDRWPPNSPELNPLDYSIWDRVAQDINYQKVNTRDDLKRENKKSCQKIDLDFVRKVIGAFLRRVYSVEKHDGGLIFEEHS